MYSNDKRIVLTLDAGGTNFVFSAIQGNKQIVEPISLSSCANNLSNCLSSLSTGFTKVKERLDKQQQQHVIAISFAFPGPADYQNGVIGDLPNLPAFRGGIALGPYLERKFSLPVYINNDGDLFAYGEALAGVLPQVNRELKAAGCEREYKNLIGITLGTGFGSGVVINNTLLSGDNGAGGDIWVFRNKLYPDMIAEESVSIRGIVREYARLSKTNNSTITPFDIFNIAEGNRNGNREAALESFEIFGEVAGDAISHMLTFVDGIVVLGGGIVGSQKYFMPALKKEMNSKLKMFSGDSFPRLQMKIYDLNADEEKEQFFKEDNVWVKIPESDETTLYLPYKQTAITTSVLGANMAISLGAYAFALSEQDNK